MNSFIQKHQKNIIGVLSGWDRIVFRGTLRLVANLAGMNAYLAHVGILMKDFKQYALDKTAELIQASSARVEAAGRPNEYLPSAGTDKEALALQIADRDHITQGLICMLRTVEPCMTYQIHRNRANKTLDLQLFHGKCMHLYQYGYDEYFGFMGARIQTWFPFAIQMWMNGRNWLMGRSSAFSATTCSASWENGHTARTRSPPATKSVPREFVFAIRSASTRSRRITRPARSSGSNARSITTEPSGSTALGTRSQRSQEASAHEQGDRGSVRPQSGHAEVNDRYLEALAMLDTSDRVEQIVGPICRGRTRKGKSFRAMRPWSQQDQRLFEAAVACGAAGDFHNRDIAHRLYPDHPAKEVSSKVTYLLRLLREHKIIRRLPRTRRYRLRPNGAQIIATILLTQKATTEQLNKAAG